MVGEQDWFDGTLGACPVMAILRGYSTRDTLALAHRAWDLGIILVEIPIQTDAALETLATVAAAGRDRGAVTGGMTADTADRFLNAGAAAIAIGSALEHPAQLDRLAAIIAARREPEPRTTGV